MSNTIWVLGLVGGSSSRTIQGKQTQQEVDLSVGAPQGTPRVKGELRMIPVLSAGVWTCVLSTNMSLEPRSDFHLMNCFLKMSSEFASWVELLSKKQGGFLRTLEPGWVRQGISLTFRSSTHRVLLKSEEAVLSCSLTPSSSLFTERSHVLIVCKMHSHRDCVLGWVLNKGHLKPQGQEGEKAPKMKFMGLLGPCVYSDSCKNSLGLTHFSFLN